MRKVDLMIKRHRILIISLIICACIGLLLRFLFFTVVQVGDLSLYPVLMPGDRVLIRRIHFDEKSDEKKFKQIDQQLILYFHPLLSGRLGLSRVVALPGQTRKTELAGLPITLRAPQKWDSLDFDFFDPVRMDWAIGLAMQEKPSLPWTLETSFLLDGELTTSKDLAAKFGFSIDRIDSLTSLMGGGVSLTGFVDQFRQRYPERYLLARRALMVSQKEHTGLRVENNYVALEGYAPHLSWDSRYWGFVSQKYIYGLPIVILWSYHPEGGFRWNRLFKTLH